MKSNKGGRPFTHPNGPVCAYHEHIKTEDDNFGTSRACGRNDCDSLKMWEKMKPHQVAKNACFRLSINKNTPQKRNKMRTEYMRYITGGPFSSASPLKPASKDSDGPCSPASPLKPASKEWARLMVKYANSLNEADKTALMTYGSSLGEDNLAPFQNELLSAFEKGIR